MKPYLFPFRLYKDDHKNRLILQKKMKDRNGDPIPFAQIIRELMLKEANAH